MGSIPSLPAVTPTSESSITITDTTHTHSYSTHAAADDTVQVSRESFDYYDSYRESVFLGVENFQSVLKESLWNSGSELYNILSSPLDSSGGSVYRVGAADNTLRINGKNGGEIPGKHEENEDFLKDPTSMLLSPSKSSSSRCDDVPQEPANLHTPRVVFKDGFWVGFSPHSKALLRNEAASPGKLKEGKTGSTRTAKIEDGGASIEGSLVAAADEREEKVAALQKPSLESCKERSASREELDDLSSNEVEDRSTDLANRYILAFIERFDRYYKQLSLPEAREPFNTHNHKGMKESFRRMENPLKQEEKKEHKNAIAVQLEAEEGKVFGEKQRSNIKRPEKLRKHFFSHMISQIANNMRLKRASSVEGPPVSLGNPMPPLGFSFSPAGLLLPYHLGVIDYLKETCTLNHGIPLAGASAGALAAISAACEISPQDSMHEVECLLENARRNGTLNRLHDMVSSQLYNLLPEDAHKVVSSRKACVTVSVTQLLPFKGLFISEFTSRDDIIECLLASCNVPFFFSKWPVINCRGKGCVDGYFAVPRKEFGCPPLNASRSVKVIPFSAKAMIGKASSFGEIISPDLSSKDSEILRYLGNTYVYETFPPPALYTFYCTLYKQTNLTVESGATSSLLERDEARYLPTFFPPAESAEGSSGGGFAPQQQPRSEEGGGFVAATLHEGSISKASSSSEKLGESNKLSPSPPPPSSSEKLGDSNKPYLSSSLPSSLPPPSILTLLRLTPPRKLYYRYIDAKKLMVSRFGVKELLGIALDASEDALYHELFDLGRIDAFRWLIMEYIHLEKILQKNWLAVLETIREILELFVIPEFLKKSLIGGGKGSSKALLDREIRKSCAKSPAQVLHNFLEPKPIIPEFPHGGDASLYSSNPPPDNTTLAALFNSERRGGFPSPLTLSPTKPALDRSLPSSLCDTDETTSTEELEKGEHIAGFKHFSRPFVDQNEAKLFLERIPNSLVAHLVVKVLSDKRIIPLNFSHIINSHRMQQ